jgi:hypothetical protein
MTELGYETIIGLLGFGVLYMVYKGFEFQWPSQYLSLANTYSLNIVSRSYRLFLFRFVPVFVVGVAVWSTTNKLTELGWFAIVVMGVTNVLSTNVLALVRSFESGRFNLGVNYASYHLTAIGVVGLSCLSSIIAGPLLAPLVPDPKDFLNALWTGVFVAVAGAFAMRAAGLGGPQDDYEEDYFIARAYRDVGIDFFDTLFSRAQEIGADPLLAKAVAIVEILQRPKWVRDVERAFGRLVPASRTYGAMQIKSSEPLTDLESLSRYFDANRSFLPWTWFEGGAEYDKNALWGAGGRHHGDKAYIDQLDQIYRRLFSSIEWVGDETALVEKRRYATSWGLRFISEAVSISVEHEGTLVDLAFRSTQDGAWCVEFSVPIEANAIQVVTNGNPGIEVSLAI